MKTKIVITNGKAKIVLETENSFEEDLIEKIVDSKTGYTVGTQVLTDNSFHTHRNHRIEINLKEKSNETI